eukprot:10088622-Heterocapsa_arctica.AAC.1
MLVPQGLQPSRQLHVHARARTCTLLWSCTACEAHDIRKALFTWRDFQLCMHAGDGTQPLPTNYGWCVSGCVASGCGSEGRDLLAVLARSWAAG